MDTPLPAPAGPTPRHASRLVIGGIVVAVALAAGAAAFFFLRGGPPGSPSAQPTPPAEAGFGTYESMSVDVRPSVPAYGVNADLSNVENAADFAGLPASAKTLLAKNGFAVVPGYEQEFFPLYEANRYAFAPSFVTTDSMLHNYHLFFDFLLKRVEEEKFAAALADLNVRMVAAAQRQSDELRGTAWENAARRNVAFFTVGGKLLDPAMAVPAAVADVVNRELALIDAHQGIEVSPVMAMGQNADPVAALKEDYSQYIPRGHYDRSEELRRYFRAMMWYGRLTFRLKSDDEVRSAILITAALNDAATRSGWESIYEPVNFFVGKSDDIAYPQFAAIFAKVYGSGAMHVSDADDAAKFSSFLAEAQKLEPPQINSIPIFAPNIQPDREKEIKGFRFMGQRFTIDAAIFQRLIFREVGTDTKPRMLPKGLDIPAALGSEEALGILRGMGETDFANYPENMAKMRTYLGALGTDVWTQNLYWSWLYGLRPLLDVPGDGYPSFMRNAAWVRKSLATFLGSWTELKHDTILYAKQVYAELGGGGPEERDDRGYVEPNPWVYARLASLIKLTRSGLDGRQLLTPTLADNLGLMETLALSLKDIAERELNGDPITDADYELIRSYGGQLEHFWLEVNKDEPAFKESSGPRDYLNENPAAIVADVATDPNGAVLEEGTGRIQDIYVVVPVGGKLRIAKGGVYSYYEFPWPLNDRLTDTKWRGLLDAGQAPAMPAWTDAFVAR